MGTGLAVVMGLGVGNSMAQISPGPLARPHTHLEGATKCFHCHGARRGESNMNEHCIDCHTEIDWQLQRELGLHGQEKKKDCAGCHPDHAGPDFELIAWEEGSPEAFDHNRTGWPLGGRHARLECTQCHRAEFRNGPVMELLERSRNAGTWLGLERECASCHVDSHDGTLGTECERCHSLARWAPAPRFEHASTAYPLDGRHADVECAKCHLVPGKRYRQADDGSHKPLYKPLPHEDCVACHDDPHRKTLGSTCSVCHVTTGFDRVPETAVDHSRTRFPLRGAHRTVKCAQCHAQAGAEQRRPAFETCGSCHADPHAGQATLEGRHVDCASCHDERSFERSTLTAADHVRTRYPLSGKHAAVACRSCHVKNPPGVPASSLGSAGIWLRPASETCNDCHEKAHAGQLDSRPDGGACESCHTVEGWVPSTFTKTAHADLDLRLDGAHARASCGACHGPVREGLPDLPGPAVLGSARVALTTLDPACSSCHLDPHRQSLDGACSDCHSADRFRPSRVDADRHQSFEYPLVGAHRATLCSDCHEDLTLPPTDLHLLEAKGELRNLRFEIADTRCASCHQTPHAAQFDNRPAGANCESCHGLESFKPATRFDHDRDASFSLTGGHRGVTCVSCHSAVDSIVIYRPTTSRCKDCHGARFQDQVGEDPS